MKMWPGEIFSALISSPGEGDGWPSGLIGIHAFADGLMAFAFCAIPLALLHYVRHGRDVPQPWIFTLFAAFIFAAGIVHALNVWTLWHPDFWMAGGVKLVAALLAAVSAVAFVRIIPQLLALPSRKQLSDLANELDASVRTRTADLTFTNEQLRREITQREQAEREVLRLNAELERRIAEFQTLFNLLPVGVSVATDAACREIRFNPVYAKMHGLPHQGHAPLSQSPAGAPAFRVLQGDRELAPEEWPMQRAVATNAPVRDFEKTIVRPEGSMIDVLAHAVPIRDADGHPCGCVATFQDITARNRAERQRLDFERKLQQSQKLESIGMLAGGIAHDFNNLLTGVLGHATLARHQLARGPSDVDPLLEQVELSAQRAAELCRQLLAYAGKGRFVVKPLDLNLAITQALPLLKLSISKKITLDLQLGEALPPFRGDATQIHQVLMNLATNSSESFGDRVGTITLRTHRATLDEMDLLTLTGGPDIEAGSFVCLEVSDTGCGIPPEAMTHLFAPFFTTKFVGRGLGLCAVLGIMQGHRGGIRVDSRVGAGTTFSLFFPVSSPSVAAPSTSYGTVAPLFAPAPPARGTVLVVDDEEVIRDFTKAALQDAGFTVMTAADGEEALTHLRRDATHFDAVLLDLTMPKLDGEDTLVALRMIAPSLPVILTSGFTEQPRAQQFVNRGIADFLPKPFTGAKLVALIDSVITEAHDPA